MPSGILNSMGCDLPSAKETALPFSSARYPTPTMSISFLKPWVTPCTALATSARASPCTARCSSLARFTFNTPSFCSKEMPNGTARLILPLGPCTSILSAATATFTPEGSGIGLFPMRDIVLVQPFVKSWTACCKTCRKLLLPNFAEQFAANISFARGASAHQTFGSGDDADAQPAHHRLDVVRADIETRSGTRNALDAGNDAAAIRRVLQENAQSFVAFVLVHHLESRNIALFLQNAGQFALQTRRRDIDTLMLGSYCVADAGQKIGYGISLHNSPKSLPTGFRDAGNFSLERHAAETDTAHLKLANVTARAAANATTVALANLEFGLLQFLDDFCGACH